MKYGKIAGLDADISRLVLGTMVCNLKDQALSNDLLDTFVAAGGNCVDTAYIYAGGESEKALGVWMQARNNRQKVVILGKGAHPDGASKVNAKGINGDIATSLERLQTDYMELYLLHRDDLNTPIGEIVETLNAQKAAGKIGVFGGSNWTTARIDEANAYASAHGMTGFSASSPHLGLAKVNEVMWGGCIAADEADRAWHKNKQFPMFPWSSQSSGFFTGMFKPEDLSHKDIVRVYYSEENWERLKRAQSLAVQKGATSHQIALAYVLAQPFPIFPLIGPRTVSELNDSLPAVDLSLTEREIRWLNLESASLEV